MSRRRVPGRRKSWGRGKKNDARSISYGIYATIFYPEDAAHCVTGRRGCLLTACAVSQERRAFISPHSSSQTRARTRTCLLAIEWYINTTKCIAHPKVLINSSPMVLGIRSCVCTTLRNFASASEMDFPRRELKNSWSSLPQCTLARTPVAKPLCPDSLLTRHCIFQRYCAHAERRLMQLTFVHKITRVFNVILVLRASFPIEVWFSLCRATLRYAFRESCFILDIFYCRHLSVLVKRQRKVLSLWHSSLTLI